MTKRFVKKLFIVSLAFLLILSMAQPAFACTATVVGKDVSADGHPMIARTEDVSSSHNKMFIIVPAKTYEPGAMYEDEYGFSWPMPEETYKYTATPDGYQDEGDIFESVGWNEHGVAMSATVTAEGNDEAMEADPLTEDGIYESSIVTVVLPRIKTAKEGVELIGEIMDAKGCQEGAVVLLADKDEIWYMELLSGHQYCAVKYPDDAFSVIANCYMLGKVDINDKENVYASENIVNLPKEHGFLVEEDGLINLKKTYGEPLQDYNRDRLWAGINFLDSSKNIAHDAEDFELFQKTAKKISLEDVMEFQRYRNEGTSLDANLPENKGKVRAIGVSEQAECHVMQIRKDYPDGLGGVLWMAMGNAEFTQYVPIIGGTTESFEPYTLPGGQFTPDSAYWTMRGVAGFCEIDRELYGKYVREYHKKEEARLIEELKKVEKNFIDAEPEEAIKLSTKYTVEKLKNAYEDATLIYNEINTYFLDQIGDGVYKEDYEFEIPFVPSLLGEERLVEIYKEHNIPLDDEEDEGEEDKTESFASIVTISVGEATVEGYSIEDKNYIKLRDLAATLADTEYKFSLGYNEEKQEIKISIGETYIKLDSDLTSLDKNVKPIIANPIINIDGKDFAITGYNIKGNYFFASEDIIELVKELSID